MKPTLLTIVLYLAMACSVTAEPNVGFERFDIQAERPGTTSVDSSSQATAVELDAGVQQIVVRSQERG